jgi:hypothetical protein
MYPHDDNTTMTVRFETKEFVGRFDPCTDQQFEKVCARPHLNDLFQFGTRHISTTPTPPLCLHVDTTTIEGFQDNQRSITEQFRCNVYLGFLTLIRSVFVWLYMYLLPREIGWFMTNNTHEVGFNMDCLWCYLIFSPKSLII